LTVAVSGNFGCKKAVAEQSFWSCCGPFRSRFRSRVKYEIPTSHRERIDEKDYDSIPCSDTRIFASRYSNSLEIAPRNSQCNIYGDSFGFKLDRPSSSRGIWYTRGYRTLFSFFIKPSLVISEHKEDIPVTEVRVQVGKKVGTPQKRRKAHFTFLAIENKGRDTAEDVVAFIKLIKSYPESLFHKAPIQLTIIMDPQKPWITTKWPEDIGKFSDHKEPWPTALIHDKELEIRTESVTIYGKDFPIPFVIFFAFKGAKTLYLPAPQNISIRLPRKFQFTVCLRAKHLPFKEMKTYEVDARDWDNFPITEVK
jgi:hypothetical protein